MADNLVSEMRKLFNMAQDGVVASKLCNMMEDIQKNNNEDAFYAGFINHLQKAMVFYNAATCVERVMEFAAAFTTFATIKKQKEAKEGDSMASELEDDVTEVFLANILKFLVQNHNSRDKAVRYRCCQLINKILNCMGEDAMIDEDLSDSIYECMMIRIKDRSPRIRIQAVLALVRLQDPEDEECPVIDAFLHSMRTDGNADVRRTILANIALSRKTLPYVIGRTRDVKDSSRKSAFLTLAEKVSIRAFTIAQRVRLLSVGLKDRSNAVKQACGQMVKAWLRSYNQDIFKLLEAIDLEESVECAENLIDYILKEALPEKLQEYIKLVKDLGEETNGPVKLVTFDKLTPEISYFWYMLCKHLIGMGENGELMFQQLLPELTNFCEYIKFYAEKNFIDSAIITAFNGDESGTQEFILENLLKIAGLLDFSDEVGRKNLKSLVHDLLVAETMPLSLASVLVERYINAESDENKFVTDLVETIADIKQPLVQVDTTVMKENNRRNELKLARIRVAINECQEDLDNAVKSNDFHQAAVLKEQMTSHEKEKESLLDEMNMGKINEPQRVEKDDPETMLKCMTVASSMLYHVRKSAHLAKSSTLLTLKDELIFEGMKNEDPFIRNEAIKCLGHISLISKDFAAQHLVLFLQVAQVDQELLQITSVNTIFDLFLMYGLEGRIKQ
uniref:Nuclear condensin complex subunit 3 C-terminal domain-containing protein n=1 Tax=Clytia hemisphaerica TaxID=252671 RepID=A0A7M6DLJ3_9CNID